MQKPLLIVLIAVVLLAISTLAIMNNACKSSQHEWSTRIAPLISIKWGTR
jgi:Tfp pilus assembly protein PilV